MDTVKNYLKVKLIGFSNGLHTYHCREKEKPTMTVMYLAQTTWVDEAKDQICRGTQGISFGNVHLRCQLVFQVEMLSRQYNLQYI